MAAFSNVHESGAFFGALKMVFLSQEMPGLIEIHLLLLYAYDQNYTPPAATPPERMHDQNYNLSLMLYRLNRHLVLEDKHQVYPPRHFV